jgi:molecular chaperone GrpE (heat shock protein)
MDPASAIAIATASFSALKKGFSISKDVYAMAGDIGKFMDAIDSIKSNHKEQKKKYGSVGEEALQTFVANRKAQDMENELRNFLIATYGLNAWQDVLKIQAQIRKERLAMREERRRQIKQAIEISFIALVAIIGLLAVYLFAMYLKG